MKPTRLPSPFYAVPVVVGFAIFLATLVWSGPIVPTPATDAPAANEEQNRSPVDLLLTKDESRLLTVNQTSSTVSLVDVAVGKVLTEVQVGQKPSAIALTPDEKTALVTGTWSGDVTFLSLQGDRLTNTGKLYLGFEPRGVVISADGKLAYVAQTSAHKIAVIDVHARKLLAQIDGGRWPRYLALTQDGKRLAVGANGDRGVAVVDTEARELLFQDKFAGINIGQMEISKDGQYVYFPWMTYLANPISRSNIQRGWVLASRIAKLRLDEYHRREAISLDKQGEAVADPHGFALSPDEQWMVCAASGSQELLVYKVPGLPFQDYGGPGDHIDANLVKDKSRFYRIPLGGRPMFVRYSKDGQHVYVANYLDNAVQVVDVPGQKVVRTIDLGGAKEPSLVRKGEAVFFDGKRSLDQWYSCHSCHYEGHTSPMIMDTNNDGSIFTAKTVLSLRHVTKTDPWTWHGWQESLDGAMHKSFTDTMQGKPPSNDDVKALIAYLDTLEPPPNPFRKADGSLSESAERGKLIFESETAGCARCHNGPHFTSKRIFNVGTGSKRDRYPGYSPPSLLGIYDRVLYIHDGRASSLEEVLRGVHAPENVTKQGKLTEEELRDLVEYVKSL
jgi:YVTN family beta-propeller protein